MRKIIAFAIVALSSLTMSAASAQSTATGQSDAFVESIGMDTHFDYRNTPYYLAYDQERASLLALHVRHIRDGSESPNPDYLAKLSDFCKHGIKHVVGFPISVTPARIEASLAKYGPECVDYVEPANEYDQYTDYGAKEPDWKERLIAEQRTLYTTIKSSPAYKNILVAGPALSKSSLFSDLGNIEQYVDIGNDHISTCDHDPEPTSTHHMGMDLIRPAIPSKPVWTSETQYTDNPGTRCYLPDDVIARYAPRTSAVRWNLGQPRTNWYEFSDQPTDPRFGHEGFVNDQGQPKQQYVAMQSLILALEDPGPAFTPTPLDVTLSGDTNKLETTVLEKRDGTYEMLLWLELPAWSTKDQAELPAVPMQTVRVHLPSSPNRADYATYGTNWKFKHQAPSTSGSDVTVRVGDAISILSFSLH